MPGKAIAKMDELKASNALDEIFNLLRRTNKYIDETMPWVLAKDETKKDRLATVLYNLIESIRFSAVMLYPYMPSTATKILDQINTDQRDFESLKEFGKYASGTKVVEKPEMLFARLDPKEIAKKVEVIEAKQKASIKAVKEKQETEAKQEITIDDFSQIELKVGKVIKCEKHPNADKLLVSQIDVGEETPRQIVSGIADVYKPEEFVGKKVIVAPGRTGAKWVQELADKYKIDYLSQSIEIGVRVEVRKEILDDMCKIIYDPTIFIKTDTYNDEIRTFCTNPGGFVAKENYYGYICVNGHSLKDIKSNNSNFAFISRVNLTEPVTNTREYGESIAKIANVLGDSKPIIQRLKDLKLGRRSTWKRINKGFIEPTLKDCVAGDLALVLPHRIVTNILEGLEKLDKIIPGVNNDETLLYGPEIKFFSNEITTDNNFKLENEEIYFIGDGAGKAGNIVTAAATGLVAARDILNKKNQS